MTGMVNFYGMLRVIDLVQEAIVALTHAIAILSGKLKATVRPGIYGKPFDFIQELSPDFGGDFPKFFFYAFVER